MKLGWCIDGHHEKPGVEPGTAGTCPFRNPAGECDCACHDHRRTS